MNSDFDTSCDLRLEMRTRNNVLWHAIFDLYASVAEFCRTYELDQGQVGSFLNLTKSPYQKTGLALTAKKICDATGYAPEFIFPSELYSGKFSTSRKYIIEVPSHRFVGLNSGHRKAFALPAHQEDSIFESELQSVVRAQLKTLTPREELVLSLRYGLDKEAEEQTLYEVAKQLRVSPARIMQIEHKALRKMRSGPRRRKLAQFYYGVFEDISNNTPTRVATQTQDTTAPTTERLVAESNRRLWRAECLVGIEELRNADWSPDHDVFPPPGGLNPEILRVRVPTNRHVDAPDDTVWVIVEGLATPS